MSKARSQGFSPDRLQRIDRFLQERYVGPGLMPCAQLLISRRGELVHETVLGMRDLERQAPAAADTVYRIYSMTKPVTAVAFMILVEEGRAALDDPVAKYIPEFADLGVFVSGLDGAFRTKPLKRPMLVLDLLRHTAGLTYSVQHRTGVDAAYRNLRLDDFHAGHDLASFVRSLARIPLEFSPGDAWNYSVATDVLGHVIEKITGQALDQVFQARIFDPLGMTDTGFFVRPDQQARFAANYMPAPGGGLTLIDDPATSPYLKPPAMFAGGAGLVATGADYLRFVQMLANGGELDGARILAPRTLRLMTRNHLPGGADIMDLSISLFAESTTPGIGFGLGFAVAVDPVKALLPSSVGEFYWGGAASTAFWVDPVDEIAVVLMTQLMPSSTYPIRRELRTMVYSALVETAG